MPAAMFVVAKPNPASTKGEHLFFGFHPETGEEHWYDDPSAGGVCQFRSATELTVGMSPAGIPEGASIKRLQWQTWVQLQAVVCDATDVDQDDPTYYHVDFRGSEPTGSYADAKSDWGAACEAIGSPVND